ncbi:hypothetical protein AMS68_007060 [Peltaster fructicola]|uniref:GED domain-containing protein n=1 Tax=Peltaster fructicola TaxID=286661 RepID=A0A6H0Y3G5_9PEZI|nr:hypothetical protein AMS68_007060 [Peltaster fructicola]
MANVKSEQGFDSTVGKATVRSRPRVVLPRRTQTPINSHEFPDLFTHQDTRMSNEPITPLSNSQIEPGSFSEAATASHTLLDNMDTQLDEDSMQTMGQQSRKLIRVIQKLETLNIDATLPSLPKFIVVGDQSAGKSSIVEALCQVQVPRAAGTCTRCPFLITTSATKNGEMWECDVSLQHRYTYEPHLDGPLAPWVEQRQETTHFATVTEKSQLGEILRRAQLALLNPRNDPQRYATVTLENEQTLVGFSPNLVCLSIKGPELPEFAFYDLPGSINVVDDESQQHLVRFVEELVKHFIRQDQTLIMLACASDVDIENSTTFRFIRDCKAVNRCLGVMTKPDLLQPSRMATVRRMLRGEIFGLGRGWFVTKQPDQAQLDAGVTQQDARVLEEQFFKTGPWGSQGFNNFAPQYGIRNLQQVVSDRLRDHILENLDDMIDRVQHRLKAVESELSHFREKDAHPMMTIVNVLESISNDVEKQITGRSTAFRPEYRIVLQKFRDALIAITPDFDASSPEHNAPICIDSDDEYEVNASPTPALSSQPSNKRRAAPTPTSSSKRVKTEAASATALRARFSIAEVKRIRGLYASSILPGHQSHEVTDVIIKTSMQGWITVLDDLLEQIDVQVQEMLTTVLRSHLDRFQRCDLYQRTLEVGLAYLETILDAQKQESRRLLQRELHKPMTFSNIEPHNHATLNELTKKRNIKRLAESWEKAEAKGAKPLSADAKKKALNDDNAIKMLGHDPHKLAVDSLVLPFSYYKIAVGRFVDNVSLLMEFEVLNELQLKLKSALVHGIGAHDPAICDQLLLEDADQERRRQMLLSEHGRLTTAMAELRALPNAAA